MLPSVLESVSDLTLHDIKELLSLARHIKRLGPTSFSPHQLDFTVALIFDENSTRTKFSFIKSLQYLKFHTIDLIPDQSSMKKGETMEETLCTLRAQGINLAIIRRSIPGELHGFKNSPPLPLINGGDGMHQHPTQALLDLLTMIENGEDPKGKTVAIIGDSRHSRVTHSLLQLFEMWETKVILCGPKSSLPRPYESPFISWSNDVNETIERADILYLLRMQNERHAKFQDSNFFSDYAQLFQINGERLEKYPRPIYHPGPSNISVEISRDVLKGPWYRGYSQVEHAIYVRMALLWTYYLDHKRQAKGHGPEVRR